MIGSFWNLCRACPSMPVDKLHSEYRSTYRWHEYTGNSRPEVVRKPPVPNHFGPINEPPLPRRKKCPELAYRTHDFISGSDNAPATNLRNDGEHVTRARSEERGTPSRRSKSEGPPGVANGRAYAYQNGVAEKPNGTVPEKAATAYELEPLVNDAEEHRPIEKHSSGVEPKSNRPFTQMADQERHHHNLTRKENYGFSEEGADKSGNNKLVNGTGPHNEEWYKEVIELRKKAGEYKCRGWGIEIDPELYKKQKELWDQVSRRSSLSALSLASSVHRPITKEEKEQENNKKSSPTKSTKGRVPGQAHAGDNKTVPDGPILPQRVQTIRHHLERTTGPDVEEGALLPSPTREKLMPTIPKSKESEPYSSQRGSPKKSATSRHGSPQKGSPQKGSPKKTMKGRSQSVGPSVIDANESPKRQVRSVSQAPSAAKTSKKTPVSTPTTGERRPRPYDEESHDKDGGVSIASHSPQPPPAEITEHIVKSPPEPTRVKSPEQIIMRSPDPVNWTVPLDTGKTFTVTQNVKDGENFSRPQSEVKASTPIERPPPAPQSAPPELAEQAKMEAWKNSEVSSGGGVGGINSGRPSPTGIKKPPEIRYDKPVPGSTLRCLDDPSFDSEPVTVRSTAVDVLEKARDRFDRFWGGVKEESV